MIDLQIAQFWAETFDKIGTLAYFLRLYRLSDWAWGKSEVWFDALEERIYYRS